MNELHEGTRTPPGLAGERGAPLVRRALSMQARYSNRLAAVLMAALGMAALAWYYGHQVSRQRQLTSAHQANTNVEAATEMRLPAIEAVQTPIEAGLLNPISRTPPVWIADNGGRISPIASASSPAITLPPLLQTKPSTGFGTGTGGGRAAARSRLDRRYDGETYGTEDAQSGSAVPFSELRTTADAAPIHGETMPSPTVRAAGADLPAPSGPLAGPSAAPISARRQQGRSLLLSKGTFIDCTLEAAIESTLPGITTCVTAADTYGADGRLVLLRRGTRLFGETQGQVQQGAARLDVLWSEARTPDGIAVPLASPGTDELGRAGLPGTTQRHFWQRFGAAILLSTVEGAVQAGVQASSSRNGATVVYSPGTSQDVTTEVLRSTVAIPPTIVKRNGDRIEVLVARDVDFSEVYASRSAPGGS